MYTFNFYVFGHNLSIDKDLNNSVDEFDISFRRIINNKSFEINSPYHGGKIAGDLQSVVFGVAITDDDNNGNYINEVRSAKEEDYINDYNEFIKFLKEDLIVNKGIEKDYDELVDKLLCFLDMNQPEFYSVEASS